MFDKLDLVPAPCPYLSPSGQGAPRSLLSRSRPLRWATQNIAVTRTSSQRYPTISSQLTGDAMDDGNKPSNSRSLPTTNPITGVPA